MVEYISSFHWSELTAVFFGLIYVFLATKENPWCWVWGILSCGLWAWATFQLYDLWVDAILNAFYVVMGFIGLYLWVYGGKDRHALKVSKMRSRDHILVLTSGSLLALICGYFFAEYTPAAATYLDSITTVFAVFATFMTIHKKIESWIYWIVIDALYIYLYLSRGGVPFAGLYLVYTIIAISGYLQWKKKLEVLEIGN